MLLGMILRVKIVTRVSRICGMNSGQTSVPPAVGERDGLRMVRGRKVDYLVA